MFIYFFGRKSLIYFNNITQEARFFNYNQAVQKKAV